MIFPEFLRLRSEFLRAIRSFFYSQGFLELDVPALVPTPGQEPYLEPFETTLRDHDGRTHDAFLITSPEYACKKALAQGVQKVFSLQHVFRNNEFLGGLHQPEFMMLEWYCAGATYLEIMDDVQSLMRSVAAGFSRRSQEERRKLPARLATTRVVAGGKLAATPDQWQRLLVKDVFKKFANIHEDELLHPHTTDRYEDWFYRIFLNQIEPYLQAPTILYDYPAPMAALARLKPNDLRYAERFEVYWHGIELANAFSELTDPDEQRRRFLHEQEIRKSLGRAVHPIDESFLAALAHMPPSAGIALGVDRLLMLMHGCKDIEEVVLFPASKDFGNR